MTTYALDLCAEHRPTNVCRIWCATSWRSESRRGTRRDTPPAWKILSAPAFSRLKIAKFLAAWICLSCEISLFSKALNISLTMLSVDCIVSACFFKAAVSLRAASMASLFLGSRTSNFLISLKASGRFPLPSSACALRKRDLISPGVISKEAVASASALS